MQKPIVRDMFFLAQKSQPTTKDDLNDVRNLLDTFMANRAHCVGMAANMIGVKKRFIVVEFMNMPLIMINPKIIAKQDRYETEEGCLSLSGMRKAIRYRNITVAYEDMQFVRHTQAFTGFTAQIIQHEIDHCDGIVIIRKQERGIEPLSSLCSVLLSVPGRGAALGITEALDEIVWCVEGKHVGDFRYGKRGGFQKNFRSFYFLVSDIAAQ